MMRTLTPALIRMAKGCIDTAPVWAFRTTKDEFGHKVREPIAALWQPLLRRLRRQAQTEHQRRLADYKRLFPDRPKIWPKFHTISVATFYADGWRGREQTCRVCRSRFYSDRKWHCSDACARRFASQQLAARRSKARAQARAGRTCAVCAAPLDALRSSKKYCSVKCRVAAHRQTQRQRLAGTGARP
jgi:hypothetical protein